MSTKKSPQIMLAGSDFGKALNQIRQDANLTNKQIAQALGFKSDSMVSHFHSGRNIPSKEDLQKLRQLLPSQRLKLRLDEAYVAYCLTWNEIVDRSDSYEAQVQTVNELIELGQTTQALKTAKEFHDESLDVDFRITMEDLIAEIYFRTGHYHKAIQLANSIREDQSGQPMAKLIRSCGLRGIVLRSTNNRRYLERAYIEINSALEMFRSNRKAVVGVPDIQDWYELMLEIERVLLKLKLSSGEDQKRIAEAARNHFEHRLMLSGTLKEKMECLDIIGRCSILLSDQSRVQDVLSEAKSQAHLPRSFEERFLILEGQLNMLSAKFDEASWCFEKAHERSVSWNNLHHARVASRHLLNLKLV